MAKKTDAPEPRRRGKQKAPTKVLISIRLDPAIVTAYRASGPGWQTRMADDLKRGAKRLPKS